MRWRMMILLGGMLVVCGGDGRGAHARAQGPARAPVAWNDSTTLALVERATRRRAEQLADTGLVDYRAQARGYLTFLARIGEGLLDAPRVVKTDQLALEVYWRAPNLSKQRIIGRRDTLLLPTDLAYHRDHLGIVQNNFPDIIRLGDGDEVSDVPHPLSRRGLGLYDFAITDSFRIRLGGAEAVEVYEVKVRPRDDRAARIVGAVYIDRAGAQVVRMAFNFTRAAFVDRQLQDLFIILENRLIEGRFWLPSRQEIEIRRAVTWMEYPFMGIIRGRWEIGEYQTNVDLAPAIFTGPEIVEAPLAERRRYAWQGSVLDSLPPDVRVTTGAEVKQVQEEVRMLVRAQALERTAGTRLAARTISDFVRVNRVEGLAVGGGASVRLAPGWSASLRGRVGHEPFGRVGLTHETPWGAVAELFVMHDLRDLGVVAERSTTINTIAAQEFGSDYTDPMRVSGFGLAARRPVAEGMELRMTIGAEQQRPAAVHARPVTGRYEPTTPARAIDALRATVAMERSAMPSGERGEVGGRLEIQGRAGRSSGDDESPLPTTLRMLLDVEASRSMGAGQLVLRTIAGGVGTVGGGAVPVQELIAFGGPITGPGYDYHAYRGRAGFTQRLEWRAAVAAPGFSLGRYGRVPDRVTLAPYVQLLGVSGEGGRPSVGLAGLFFFDLLRVDVSAGLRGGGVRLGVDLSRSFWRVL